MNKKLELCKGLQQVFLTKAIDCTKPFYYFHNKLHFFNLPNAYTFGQLIMTRS